MRPNISFNFNFPFWQLSLVLKTILTVRTFRFERLHFWRLCPAACMGQKAVHCSVTYADLFRWQSIFLPSWIVVCTHLCVYVFNFMDVFHTPLWAFSIYMSIFAAPLNFLCWSDSDIISPFLSGILSCASS